MAPMTARTQMTRGIALHRYGKLADAIDQLLNVL